MVCDSISRRLLVVVLASMVWACTGRNVNSGEFLCQSSHDCAWGWHCVISPKPAFDGRKVCVDPTQMPDSGPDGDLPDGDLPDGDLPDGDLGVADQTIDQTSDLGGKDSATPDLSPRPQVILLADHAAGLATIHADGTQFKALSVGWPSVTGQTATLVGAVADPSPFAQTPRQAGFTVELSPTLGKVHWYQDSSSSLQGLVALRPDGQVSWLYTSRQVTREVAVSLDGSRAAVMRSLDSVVLLRTDDTRYPNGRFSLEVRSPTLPKDHVFEVQRRSLTFVGHWLYFVAKTGLATTPSFGLYRIAADTGAKMEPINLPQVEGKPLQFVRDQLVAGADRLIVQAAHEGHAKCEGVASNCWWTADRLELIAVYVDGRTINLSQRPAFYAPRGSAYDDITKTVYSDNGAGAVQLALSANGEHVAYVERLASEQQLYVASINGSTAPVHVTSPARVSQAAQRLSHLRFINDQTLVFAASSTAGDVSKSTFFRYDIKKQRLFSLRAAQSNGPFSLLGLSFVRQSWLSPGRGFFYYTTTATATADRHELFVVDASDWSHRTLASNLSRYWVSCGASAYFAGWPDAQSKTQQLYRVNSQAPKTPTVETSFSGPVRLLRIAFSPSCRRLALVTVLCLMDACYLHSDARLYAAETERIAKTLLRLTGDLASFDIESLVLASDDRRLAYVTSNGSSENALHVSPLNEAGNSQTIRQSKAGMPELFSMTPEPSGP
jgi:hypothetical protein